MDICPYQMLKGQTGTCCEKLVFINREAKKKSKKI
jgi:hypothetical protein